MIKGIHIIDASNMTNDAMRKKINKVGAYSDEITIITTIHMDATIEDTPNGQILTIDIHENQKYSEGELAELNKLQDYYPDLTIKVIDRSEQLTAAIFPENTIIKKDRD